MHPLNIYHARYKEMRRERSSFLRRHFPKRLLALANKLNSCMCAASEQYSGRKTYGVE